MLPDTEHLAFKFNALPAPATPLIGRAEAAETVGIFLLSKGVHILTLVGPPGVGKTRLGIHVATEVASTFR
ncbi:MAG TPA: hypothetical protein VK880_12630, partial [Anaerolineales bacterium]|nr:hypothetical protein [Anaerolineales bacterium]